MKVDYTRVLLQIITLIFTCLLLINPLLADTFMKYGNNGTASCTNYCADGIKWPGSTGSGGSVGACSTAKEVRSGGESKSIGCDDVPGFLPGGQLECKCEYGKLPIRAHAKETIGSHWYMETDVSLSNNGRIDGRTSIKSCQRKGVTGGVSVILLDKDSNVLYRTETRSYGVNGKGLDNRCESRSESWDEQIPTNIAEQTGGFIIYQAHNPKSRINKGDVEELVNMGLKVYTATQAGN